MPQILQLDDSTDTELQYYTVSEEELQEKIAELYSSLGNTERLEVRTD